MDEYVEEQPITASEIWPRLPESKLELMGGRLIAGNSLAGSRYLLWAILQTLGPRAALPLAPLEQWWQALAAAFRAPPSLATPRAWSAWAAQAAHTPGVAQPESSWNWQHHEAWSLLMMGLYRALREDENSALGRSIQRFVLRLGDDALMPDLQCFRRDRLHRLQSYYYDGPADLVIEVALPGSVSPEYALKRNHYALGGVPEYWIVAPAARHIEFLRLADGNYVAYEPDAAGRYRSSALPGLVCTPARLWACLDDKDERHGLGEGIFTIEPTALTIGPSTWSREREDWSWEWRPFTPSVALRPTPISFAQFIDWCPESKFELVDGKLSIGGWDGTRKVLGLLLMTFGLEDAVTLLHPRQWVAALLSEEADRQQDAARRDAWWGLARQAAQLLRDRFGVGRVAVVGDLVRRAPLHFWSEITLAVWGLPKERHSLYGALDELPDTPSIDIRDAEDASARQQVAFAEAIDL